MKAVCWEGTNDIRVERVPDPDIVARRRIAHFGWAYGYTRRTDP
jgi:hypothetical protein